MTVAIDTLADINFYHCAQSVIMIVLEGGDLQSPNNMVNLLKSYASLDPISLERKPPSFINSDKIEMAVQNGQGNEKFLADSILQSGTICLAADRTLDMSPYIRLTIGDRLRMPAQYGGTIIVTDSATHKKYLSLFRQFSGKGVEYFADARPKINGNLTHFGEIVSCLQKIRVLTPPIIMNNSESHNLAGSDLQAIREMLGGLTSTSDQILKKLSTQDVIMVAISKMVADHSNAIASITRSNEVVQKALAASSERDQHLLSQIKSLTDRLDEI